MQRMWTLMWTIFLAGAVVLAQVPDLAGIEQRLDEARSAVARAERTVPAAERSALERDLGDLEDEVAYLRVKTRRGERISENERRDLATRIDRFVQRANDRARSTTAPASRAIPVGTEVDVRLQTPLNSGTAQVEQRVEATTMVNLYQGDDLLLPAGSLLVGHVAAVDRASRSDRKGSLSISFTRLTARQRTHDVRVSVTQALESEGLKGEAGRIGAGAGVGAILGGILGGVKGAITGILVGGGGVLVATEGKDVDLPQGMVLRVRFDSAVPLN